MATILTASFACIAIHANSTVFRTALLLRRPDLKFMSQAQLFTLHFLYDLHGLDAYGADALQ